MQFMQLYWIPWTEFDQNRKNSLENYIYREDLRISKAPKKGCEMFSCVI